LQFKEILAIVLIVAMMLTEQPWDLVPLESIEQALVVVTCHSSGDAIRGQDVDPNATAIMIHE
jgi:hypothetical protein